TVAIEAGAKVERGVVAQHHEEALPCRLVEAELLLELLDQLGIDAAPRARGALVASARRTAPRARLLRAGAAHARRRSTRLAAEARDHHVDRSARRRLHDDEIGQDDPG